MHPTAPIVYIPSKCMTVEAMYSLGLSPVLSQRNPLFFHGAVLAVVATFAVVEIRI